MLRRECTLTSFKLVTQLTTSLLFKELLSVEVVYFVEEKNNKDMFKEI